MGKWRREVRVLWVLLLGVGREVGEVDGGEGEWVNDHAGWIIGSMVLATVVWVSVLVVEEVER